MTATEFRASVEIGSNLRRVIHAARTHPDRPEGYLTQEETARRIGKTAVWYRKIENGGTFTASVSTVCDICQVLAIGPGLLRSLGYTDLAEELDLRLILGRQVIIEEGDLATLDAAERTALEIILARLGKQGSWRDKGV